jgi:hypothetical protein
VLKYPPHFYDRLRKRPGEYSSPDSLPVLFFGEIFKANIATIYLNPGANLRCMKSLSELGASSRESLSDEQCDRVIEAMERYFQCLGGDLGRFWSRLERVTKVMGFDYGEGGGAHLDLVQESTQPAWSSLPEHVQASLWNSDSHFLAWILEDFRFQVLVCNGKTTLKCVESLVPNAQRVDSGKLGRLTWYAGTGYLGRRLIGIVGWNIPLGRPTGLGNEGEEELGERLLNRLHTYGILPLKPQS